MNHESAAELSKIMLEVGALLDRSVEVVQRGCSEIEANAHRAAVARAMGALLIDVMNPLYEAFPEVRPAALIDHRAGRLAAGRLIETWFVSRLLFTTSVGDAGPTTWEEQIRVLRATSPEQAYDKAVKLGQSGEHEYANEADVAVRVRFLGLLDLEDLGAELLEDGIEIASRRSDSAMTPVPRDRLTAFWWRANQDRTAQEVLDTRPAEVPSADPARKS